VGRAEALSRAAGFVADQRGVDLTLTLTTPSGEPLVIVDGMDDEYRSERLVLVAPRRREPPG
jgi:hypothetical protein